jgi:hypothetical protein
MKPIGALLLVLLPWTGLSSPQTNFQNEAQAQPYSKWPRLMRVMSHDPHFTPTSTACFYKRKPEWQKIIDSAWGSGVSTSQKLNTFDLYAAYVRAYNPTFGYTLMNWDSVSAYWRARINDSTSRGGFSAIMSALARQLHDSHAWAWDNIMASTPLNPGTPILADISFDGDGTFDISGAVSHFGAGLTALPDSSLLVYSVVPSHPLGLQPGDIVLGYEGIPWRSLVRELIDAGVPVVQYNACTQSASAYNVLISVGMNWHLFDTIDVKKHSTGQVVHLPTAPMITLQPHGGLINGAQLAIPGVPMPGWVETPDGNISSAGVSAGVVQGRDIGYIYVVHHLSNNVGTMFDSAVAALAQTRGLIIDLRFDLGGFSGLNAGIGRLASFAGSTLVTFRRASSYDLGPLIQTTGPDPNIPQDTISYKGRVAVLLGPTCVSYGDISALQLSYLDNVRFFGKPPHSAYGGMWFHQPHITGFNAMCPDIVIADNRSPGALMWGKEFPVDKDVWLTPDGVARGEDDVVKAALAWIETSAPEVNLETPVRFALEQNYPNPFNPNTTIRYELPGASHVRLSVFDILGREVSVLVDEKRDAGVYEVRFDGSALASGMYVYRLKAGDFVQSRRFVLLR